MMYRTPYERRARWLRVYQLGAVFVIAFVFVSLFDFVILEGLTRVDVESGRVDRSFESEDWYSFLRNVGFIGTWVVVAVGFGFVDRSLVRAIPMVVCPLVSGAGAELLKLVVVRERPVVDAVIQEGGYHFRMPMSGFIDGHNLGLPSSHAAVAFGGALMFGIFVPRLRVLMVLLACGCGYTRLITGAHFGSDVFVGGVIGAAAAYWIGSLGGGADRKYRL